MRALILSVIVLSGLELAAQPGRFTPGPGLSGDPHWRSPVSTSAALPTTGNQPGDARLDLSTFTLYVWDGDSWELPPGGSGGAPTGPAGGALAGMYPNPTLAANYAASATPGGPATTAVSLTADLVLGVSTSGGYAASASEAGPATSALAFAVDPADCDPGEVQIGSLINGDAICETAEPGGVTDHGALTGLSDDDHSQYALLAGRSGASTFGTRIILPSGSSSSPAVTLGTDDGTGIYRSGGELRFNVGGLGFHLAWNYLHLVRDEAQILIGSNNDAGVRRVSAGQIAPATGMAAGVGSIIVKTLDFSVQASAPTCSTPSLYVNSAASNTLCYCDGTTWNVITGPGPC